MGLDMYLYKEYYIGANYEHNNVTGTFEIFKNGEKVNLELKDIKYVYNEAVYWRKANMIHKWFVDNVQEGADDCKRYYVEREQLKELLETCKKVLENHELTQELLPTQDGFFFGSIEYDEDYVNDIKYTAEQLKGLNLESEEYGFSYYYESSW